MFASEIRDHTDRRKAPTEQDLNDFLSRMRFSESYGLNVDGSLSMDGGLELNGVADGIAIHGSEDSLRGSFAFFYVDPTRPTVMRTISIYEISDTTICSSLDIVREIVRTYATKGDLSRNYSWSLNIAHENEMLYNCRLLAGDFRDLDVVLASARSLDRWSHVSG